jgi:hypothetical protein
VRCGSVALSLSPCCYYYFFNFCQHFSFGMTESKSSREVDDTMAEPTIESRLAELELRLGGSRPSLLNSSHRASRASDIDISSRLDQVMRSAASSSIAPKGNNPSASSSSSSSSSLRKNTESLISKRSALHEDCRAIDRLLSELDVISPTVGPTAGGEGKNNLNSSALIFRRMEILASSETMKRDMDLLAHVRDLTSIGTRTDVASGAKAAIIAVNSPSSAAAASRVVNCPIISSERYNFPSDPMAVQKLDAICLRVAELIERTAMASQRADVMLKSYGNIMMALSEKMVLAEEQIIRR